MNRGRDPPGKEDRKNDWEDFTGRSSKDYVRVSTVRARGYAAGKVADRDGCENVERMDLQHLAEAACGQAGVDFGTVGRRIAADQEKEGICMRVNDLVQVIENSDRLKIIKDGKVIFVNYRYFMPERYGTEIIKKFRSVPEFRHKEWKERDLMPPVEPEKLAEYRFADLQMSLYYTIYI